MKRRTGYEVLAAGSLAIGGAAATLALAGAALQQALSVAASALCAVAFAVPGLYFLAYARRLRRREVALGHVASFAASRGTIGMGDLAEELAVSREDAEKILRTAVREGHVRGRFDEAGRFTAESKLADAVGGRP